MLNPHSFIRRSTHIHLQINGSMNFPKCTVCVYTIMYVYIYVYLYILYILHAHKYCERSNCVSFSLRFFLVVVVVAALQLSLSFIGFVKCAENEPRIHKHNVNGRK